MAEYQAPVVVAAAPEAITPLMKRLRVNFWFTSLVPPSLGLRLINLSFISHIANQIFIQKQMRIILNKAYNSVTYDVKRRLNHLYSFSKHRQGRIAVATGDSAGSINTLARLI